MGRQLTKAEVFAAVKTEEVPVPELDGVFVIRSLSAGEWSEVKAQNSDWLKISFGDMSTEAAMRASMEVGMDYKEMERCKERATIMAVAFALSTVEGDVWTPAEVEAISPPSIVERLGDRVFAISGVTLDDLAADITGLAAAAQQAA